MSAPAPVHPSNRYEQLRGTTLGTIRATIRPEAYRRSTARALWWALFDLGLYLAAMVALFRSGNPIARLALGVLAGCAVAFMFVWAHDAAHGALFRSKKVANVLGTALMLPSLNMYRLWIYGHNKVHHGFTSLSTIDWIWRPRTPSEYRSMSRFGRFVYRLERSPWTCALHYGLRVWWPGMVRFRPDAKVRNQPRYRLDKLATLAFAVVLGAVAYRFGGGLLGALTAVVVPFVVFTYFIAVFVYLHHTHPDIPFFDVRAEWSPAIGQLACTTVVRCSKLSELLTHNILIHTPHHVDTRIPFYRLKQAYNDLDRSFHEHLHEYRFSIARVRSIFRTCQLYDFDTKTWYTFRAARDLLDAGAPAARPVAA